ncbi:hypothetical protein [Vibrio scophthalmi]|uniref:Uncharacterized protein n=1 Tax=Vibrio scophthalmi TaxID=45658 RepID=A0A1C7FI28_9VIBR|nr:hypothetical protein [Vibrio scophthalmi]ANU39438.1 hypothetical protein VSVS05_04403 [Vibrio scophthalmi]
MTKLLRDTGVHRIKHITYDIAQQYLQDSKNLGFSNKHMSNIKCSLQRVIDISSPGKTLQTPDIEKEFSANFNSKNKNLLANKNRAYREYDLNKIIKTMSTSHVLSTLIAYNAGLRAEELLTIRRREEGKPSQHREWRSDRFHGREDGVRYLVTGKNGLTREVYINKSLAEQLEKLRFDTPQVHYDRKIKYELRYNLSGGNAFSKAFSRASYQTLGWSLGAHGLRFCYAQNRMDRELIDIPYEEAKSIISQELGHFRPEISDRYLYPFGK